MTDDDDTFPEASVAVTERVFAASWVRFTEMPKTPPAAVTVYMPAPPVIVIVVSASALPCTRMEGAFNVVEVVVRTGAGGAVVSMTCTVLVTGVALFPEASVAL